jgi:hypothetical protein
MKLLRPLAGYTLHDHKTKDSIHRELQTKSILDKIDEYRWNWLLHLQRMPKSRIPLKSYHYRPQGRRTIGRPKKLGGSSCNSGDGTDQMVQSLMFMMMILKSKPMKGKSGFFSPASKHGYKAGTSKLANVSSGAIMCVELRYKLRTFISS